MNNFSSIDFSIIVTTKNSEKFIERNLLSIIKQKFTNYEIIIVDGFSNDGTLKILNKYKKIIKKKKIIYKINGGPYNAMNIGLKSSLGEYVTFLNSDDYFYDDNVLSIIKKNLAKNDVICLYGNIKIIKINKIFRNWVSQKFNLRKFVNGWHPPHPGMFVKREMLIKLKGFDTNYKIASDYDLMFKMFYSKKIIPKYVNKFLVYMETGGVSSKLKNIILGNYECYKIRKSNGLKDIFFVFKKIYNKIRQIKCFHTSQS